MTKRFQNLITEQRESFQKVVEAMHKTAKQHGQELSDAEATGAARNLLSFAELIIQIHRNSIKKPIAVQQHPKQQQQQREKLEKEQAVLDRQMEGLISLRSSLSRAEYVRQKKRIIKRQQEIDEAIVTLL